MGKYLTQVILFITNFLSYKYSINSCQMASLVPQLLIQHSRCKQSTSENTTHKVHQALLWLTCHMPFQQVHPRTHSQLLPSWRGAGCWQWEDGHLQPLHRSNLAPRNGSGRCHHTSQEFVHSSPTTQIIRIQLYILNSVTEQSCDATYVSRTVHPSCTSVWQVDLGRIRWIKGTAKSEVSMVISPRTAYTNAQQQLPFCLVAYWKVEWHPLYVFEFC